VTRCGDRLAPVVGIVGGLASGKSTVGRLLADRGARVVDADRIGHDVLTLPGIKEALVRAFGQDILTDGGAVSRPRLAERAFGCAEHVAKLNGIVHPEILRRARAQVERLRRQDGVPLVVLDAALLLETKLDSEICQAVLFVDASAELRRQRACSRRRMSREQFDRREQVQLPPESKRKKADFVVSNDGSPADLEDQIEGLWPRLCSVTGG